MQICEIFGDTFQGEGPFSGYLATFIRTAKCVRPFCAFCDTSYSWKSGKEMSAEEILKKVEIYKSKLVVITGGEPFIWKDIYVLVDLLEGHSYKVQIETSGKAEIDFTPVLGISSSCTIVCSPKQYNGKFIIKDSAIKRSDYFKFVVENKKELANVLEFISWYVPSKYDKCYLMPKTTYNKFKDREIMRNVWKMASQEGLKLSLRYQAIIWGKKRGM